MKTRFLGFIMTITPDSLVKKLEAATKDRTTYKMAGDIMQVFLDGMLIRQIPLGSGQVISSQSTTYR